MSSRLRFRRSRPVELAGDVVVSSSMAWFAIRVSRNFSRTGFSPPLSLSLVLMGSSEGGAAPDDGCGDSRRMLVGGVMDS
jgi:hypothetical protein